MSGSLDSGSLRAEIDERGSAAFLVTLGEDRPHVVSVAVEVLADPPDGDDSWPRLRVGAGRSTPRNVEVRPSVTVLWPAGPDHPDFSLLVDGQASVDPDGTTISITPTNAILHTSQPSSPDRRC